MMNADTQISTKKDTVWELFREEEALIVRLLEELENANPLQDYQQFYNIFNHLATISKRFERKKMIIDALLEKDNRSAWVNNLLAPQKIILDLLLVIRQELRLQSYEGLNLIINDLAFHISHLLHLENEVLFPEFIKSFDEASLRELRKKADKIGWMQASAKKVAELADKLKLGEGSLTLAQVNMLFQQLYIDLTYIDENNRILFYNHHQTRFFKRSVGVIGREVQYCHPPETMAMVEEILRKFRNGEAQETSFWMDIKDRKILVRYLAVRDEQKKYKGVLELTQDITDLKNIEGERQTLVWD